ncbi:hypothetical protein [Sphingobium sp. CAP-1]|uniref:hypothetical protein n=1 Tax=Sphingobium sp. CAP-1 TaxID=2676077 RepID=UPI003FA699A6
MALLIPKGGCFIGSPCRTYRHLFLAQVIALIGTGLAILALGLLAYDIAGGNAGAVLGTALAIKTIANIGVAPAVGAYAAGNQTGGQLCVSP